MLDLKLIRENPDLVRAGLKTRHSPVDISAVLELDERRRAAITEGDRLKNERNSVSKKIGELKGSVRTFYSDPIQASQLIERGDVADHALTLPPGGTYRAWMTLSA